MSSGSLPCPSYHSTRSGCLVAFTLLRPPELPKTQIQTRHYPPSKTLNGSPGANSNALAGIQRASLSASALRLFPSSSSRHTLKSGPLSGCTLYPSCIFNLFPSSQIPVFYLDDLLPYIIVIYPKVLSLPQNHKLVRGQDVSLVFTLQST